VDQSQNPEHEDNSAQHENARRKIVTEVAVPLLKRRHQVEVFFDESVAIGALLAEVE